MKRFVSVFLIAAVLLTLCACAKDDASAGDYSEVYDVISDYAKRNGYSQTNADPYARDDADMAIAETATDQSFSKTNAQVDGIDEGDRIKTDGKYVYFLGGNKVRIYSAAGEESELIGCAELKLEGDFLILHMYVSDGVLMLLTHTSANDYADSERTTVYYYDVSDPASPTLIGSAAQDGWLETSRLYDGKLYLVSRYSASREPNELEPETYVPCFYRDGEKRLADSNCISIAENPAGISYIVAAVYDAKTGEIIAERSVLGAGDTIYMSLSDLYIAGSRYEDSREKVGTEGKHTVYNVSYKQYTDIMRISLSDLETAASGSVEGLLDSQFSMDERDGYLRLVTTKNFAYSTLRIDEEQGSEYAEMSTGTGEQSSSLYILGRDLSPVSELGSLAKNEEVYSVRFDGDIAYFCTFRQIDPLFAVDVSDPAAPKVLSELKISGFSEYLHTWSDDRLFGLGQEADENSGQVQSLKLVMFDTSDKANVGVKHSLVLDDINYTPALYEHTALMISPERGIFGFASDLGYHIFSYSDSMGFAEQLCLAPEGSFDTPRAVYVGENAYIASDLGLAVVSLNDYSVICSVDVN